MSGDVWIFVRHRKGIRVKLLSIKKEKPKKNLSPLEALNLTSLFALCPRSTSHAPLLPTAVNPYPTHVTAFSSQLFPKNTPYKSSNSTSVPVSLFFFFFNGNGEKERSKG